MSHILPLHQVAPDVYYVGADDRYTTRFENLWPLPHGVSYNSYYVRGSKANALIDGVETESLTRLLDHIGGEKIDYLVVNHMEPDHSGSIPALLRAFPDMKIVGNRQTMTMLAGYYEITDTARLHTVSHGDTLSLGTATLRFMLTPMVHWPETMMTFIDESGTLFTGDAFGGFGALGGVELARDMSIDEYMPEVYRYYSNIVAKYGRNVQGALGKLKELEIKTICPTHGLVWSGSHCKDIIDVYGKLSSWEAEKGVVIVTGTMYGNTERMADYLADRLATVHPDLPVRMHRASYDNLSYILADVCRYRDIIIGSATYSMEVFPPVEALLEAIRIREPRNRRLAFFSSYGWAPGAAQKRFDAFAQATGLPVVGKAQMKQNLLAAAASDLDAIVAAL